MIKQLSLIINLRQNKRKSFSEKNLTENKKLKAQNKINVNKKGLSMKLLSPRAHAIIALLIGFALMLSPNIFSFIESGGPAVLVPRTMGLVIVLSELTAENRLIGTRSVSMWLHTRFDMALGFIAAINPWLFEYSNHGVTTWLPQFLIGILLIINALLTRSTYRYKYRSQS